MWSREGPPVDLGKPKNAHEYAGVAIAHHGGGLRCSSTKNNSLSFNPKNPKSLSLGLSWVLFILYEMHVEVHTP